ncbi:MAG: hypothetical protein OEX81_02410 [Candidatus Pacebacteria bacterium]|nr:hypothetical protein [Candidatus Paceibacterota bacterium]
MSNPYQMKQTDFNASTGRGIAKILQQATIYGLEALKAVALFIKHLLTTFVGK